MHEIERSRMLSRNSHSGRTEAPSETHAVTRKIPPFLGIRRWLRFFSSVLQLGLGPREKLELRRMNYESQLARVMHSVAVNTDLACRFAMAELHELARMK